MESGRNWYQIESRAGYIPKATKTYKRPSGRPEYFKNRFTKSLETSGFIQIDDVCVLRFIAKQRGARPISQKWFYFSRFPVLCVITNQSREKVEAVEH